MDIQKILDKLPPAPYGLKDWILSDVVKNTYLIYNSKKKTCYCTRCGNTFEIEKCMEQPKHNVYTNCPCCDYPAMCKAEGIGRKGLTEKTRTLDFVRKGKTIYGVLAEVDIYFVERQPGIRRWISAIYKFNVKEQLYFKHYPEWYWGDEHWRQHKIAKVPAIPCGSYNEPNRIGLSVYTNNFNIFEKSDLKYADISDFFNRNRLTGEKLIRYIDLSLKYKSIELLRKSGFERIVLDKVDERGCKYINWRGKTLPKILKMNMGEIRKLRVLDICISEFEIYSRYKKEGVILEFDEIEIASAGEYEERKIKEVVNVVKVIKYIGSQNRTNQHKSSLGDYSDYIEDCRKLGLDIRKNRVLFPQHFHDEHLRLIKIVEEAEDGKKNSEFKKQAGKVKAFSGYEFNNLTIRVAELPRELREESAELGHCVKSYSDRVIRGDCYIFFIRHSEELNKAYYTLELVRDKENKWKVSQCRGKNNCPVTGEIQAFVDKWMAEIVNKSKRGKKAA